MTMVVANVLMVVFSVAAIFLTNLPDAAKIKKFSSIMGLLAQPFWFYVAYHSQQIGIFILTIIYTGCWFMGFWNTWIRPK